MLEEIFSKSFYGNTIGPWATALLIIVAALVVGKALLREIASSNPNLEEKVIIGFNQFGDFALNILMIYYITSGADILATQTEVNLEILRRFAAQNLEFAFPTQTLYTIGQES